MPPGKLQARSIEAAPRTGQPAALESDEELIPRVRAGDEYAFSQLVARYHTRLVRLAQSFVHTTALAEETAQETWLAVLDGLDRFEQRSRFKVWLFRILSNRAKSCALREARSVPFSMLDSSDGGTEGTHLADLFTPEGSWRFPPQDWEHKTPEKLLLSTETQRVLQDGIQSLPPAQRAVVLMRDVEGIEADEVCNLLGLTDANQRVLLHRARTALRQILDRHVRKQ